MCGLRKGVRDVLELGLKTLLSYLLGSIIGSMVVGRIRGGVDIRKVGSGNAGGTNALRTQGKMFAFWVIVIDVGKGALAAAVLPELPLPRVEPDPAIARDWLTVACAAAVIVGHIYPLWHDFRGGKGAATLVGAIVGMQPPLLIPLLAAWLVVVVVTGYVGLATMCAAASLPVYVCATVTPIPAALATFTVFVGALMIFTHRSNIARMIRGSEHRARRLWLLKR
jgi:acyl phosphate:glycerol-3-phosphate acyltransferase